MPVEPDDVALSERQIHDGYVREIRSPGLRSTFIRLQPRDGPTPVRSCEAECTVDMDGNGTVIGVTVHDYNDSDGRRL